MLALALTALIATPAHAGLDARCAELSAGGPPDDYDEIAQQDFLQNYYALATTLSPMHAPAPTRASIGIDGSVIPPLGCSRRLVLGYTQTQDTNTWPVAPRLRLVYAFPQVGQTVFYGGVAYTPPIKLAGTSASILSAELGVGVLLGESLQFGARFHATTNRTVAEVHTPAIPGDPVFQDLYIATSIGLDAMVGVRVDTVVPYVSVGLTDVSTFFYMGDESVTINNFHPYLGLVASAGADAQVTDNLRLVLEFYAAPGGYTLPDPNVTTLAGLGRYGRLYTGRARLALEL